MYVEQLGLHINPSYPFLATSVDGLIHCDKCGTGVLEIKCPYGTKGHKWRDMNPEDCAEVASFMCTKDSNGQLLLKQNHNYFYQVMGQMALIETDWSDFVVWTKKGISIQRIKFQPEFWKNKMSCFLKNFYVRYFVPELYTLRIKRGRMLCHM